VRISCSNQVQAKWALDYHYGMSDLSRFSNLGTFPCRYAILSNSFSRRAGADEKVRRGIGAAAQCKWLECAQAADGTERDGTGRDGTGRDGTGRDGTDRGRSVDIAAY